jgi:hypothetical protein
MAVFVAVMSIVSIAVEVYQLHKQELNIREMSKMTGQVLVERRSVMAGVDAILETIDSAQLVPGR